jgi:hypothetical protein
MMDHRTLGNNMMEQLRYHLGFHVDKEPLYRKNRDGVYVSVSTGDVLVKKFADERRNEHDHEVTVCSKAYSPAQMEDTILRPTEELLKQGWTWPEWKAKRRSPIQIESGGKRAYVELVYPDHKIKVGGVDDVMPRFMGFNSFNTTTKAGGLAGGLQIICLNGLHRSFDFDGVKAIRHIGNNVQAQVGRLVELAKTFLGRFDSMAGEWDALHATKPKVERGLAAVQSISVRSGRKIAGRENLRSMNGWSWFSKITNYLSYNYKGNVGTIHRKQQQATDILLGGPYEYPEALTQDDRYRVQSIYTGISYEGLNRD